MLPGIGFFGSDALAQILIGVLQEQGFKIEALWAPNERKAQAICSRFSIPIHSTIIDRVLLLPSVHLIIIASPPHFHHQIASKACHIGKHVVCNWPPSHTIEDMLSMQRAAANYPSLITVISTVLRFVPVFNLMRKLIINERFLGDLRLINASVYCDVISINQEKSIVWDRHMGGGLLSVYGTNLIDIISYVTGMRAERVHGNMLCINQFSTNPILSNNADDFVTFQLELLPNNEKNDGDEQKSISNINRTRSVLAMITLNGLQNVPQIKHELYVYGTNGYLVCRDTDLYTCLNDDIHKQPQALQRHVVKNHLHNHQQKVPSTMNYFQQQQQNERAVATAVGEKLIYSSAAESRSQVQQQRHLPEDSESTLSFHAYPPIYLTGLENMITALRNAFATSINGVKTDDADNNNNNNNNNDINDSSSVENFSNHNDKPFNESSLMMFHWDKEPVSQAASFEDGIYLRSVIEAIKLSSDLKEWVRLVPQEQ